MKLKRKLLAGLLTLCMAVGMAVPAFAAGDPLTISFYYGGAEYGYYQMAGSMSVISIPMPDGSMLQEPSDMWKTQAMSRCIPPLKAISIRRTKASPALNQTSLWRICTMMWRSQTHLPLLFRFLTDQNIVRKSRLLLYVCRMDGKGRKGRI